MKQASFKPEARRQRPEADMKGKVAIVAGTTGIGRAIAKRFAAGGASALACGIDVAANNDLARTPRRMG